MKYQKRDVLDLSSLYTGYHRLLQAVFGIKEIYYRVSSADDYLAIVQEGLLPAPLTQDSIEKIETVLQTITEREANVLRQRLGINNDRHTLKEAAEVFNLTPERVRQIEARALMKLRHPARSGKLATIPIRWADIQKKTARLLLEIEEQVSDLTDKLASAVDIIKERLDSSLEQGELLCPLKILKANIEAEKAKQDKREPLLDTPISELELSVRTANCLEAANIVYIRDLVRKSEAEILHYRNFGRKSLNELKNILVGMGLSFGMTLPEKED